VLFRGRTAEDFKLTTGTFVRVDALRTALLSTLPLLTDAMIAGENRDYITAMAWVNSAEASKLIGSVPAAGGDELLIHDDLHAHIA